MKLRDIFNHISIMLEFLYNRTTVTPKCHRNNRPILLFWSKERKNNTEDFIKTFSISIFYTFVNSRTAFICIAFYYRQYPCHEKSSLCGNRTWHRTKRSYWWQDSCSHCGDGSLGCKDSTPATSFNVFILCHNLLPFNRWWMYVIHNSQSMHS